MMDYLHGMQAKLLYERMYLRCSIRLAVIADTLRMPAEAAVENTRQLCAWRTGGKCFITFSNGRLELQGRPSDGTAKHLKHDCMTEI